VNDCAATCAAVVKYSFAALLARCEGRELVKSGVYTTMHVIELVATSTSLNHHVEAMQSTFGILC
jgi:hypothetical protein